MTTQYFFCGIGGSGMLPLAAILRAGGARVTGSDRSLDAGRLGNKFEYLRSLGIGLAPQDGTGLKDGMTLVTSAAVEETMPDVVRANELGLDRITRPQLLAQLLNTAQKKHRRRRHQRQVDGYRHDRMDPSRAAPPADGNEWRGDEEFRIARIALRLGTGRRS